MRVQGIDDLVVLNLRGRWHEKWISYRLLAELCRKQQALRRLGWSLPTAGVSQAIAHKHGERIWVDWLFQAHLRAVPLVEGRLQGERLAAARDAIHTTLIASQKQNHSRRAHLSKAATTRLPVGGTVSFAIVLVMLVLKIAHLAEEAWLAYAPLVLGVSAGLSAAFFALRGYTEFELLANQSERMMGLLETLDKRLDEADHDDPLASQELGADLSHLAQAMLQDVAGWAQLFRVKAVETS